MNKLYRFHYGDYAIGENEQLYERMAQRGWQLETRGAYFSKFRKLQPAARRYRIELSSPAMLDEQAMPDEQIALYEDCGWEFVTNHGLVHVFTAPEDSDAPEFYTDPRQQADTLKALRRSYRNCWWVIALIVGIHALLAFSVAKDPAQVLPGTWSSFVIACFRSTQLVLLYASILLQEVYRTLYGGVRTALLYRRLKAGKPLNHAPRKRMVYNAVSAVLIACCVFFGACSLLQWVSIQKTEMPLHTSEPYLLLADDLGWEGERNSLFYQDDKSSRVETGRSFLAEMWDTREGVGDGSLSRSAWLYQDVYRVYDVRLIPTLVHALMYDSTFADGPENYKALAIDGLDAAYSCGLDGIAVKGNLVYYITYSESCTEELFSALAQKLSK